MGGGKNTSQVVAGPPWGTGSVMAPRCLSVETATPELRNNFSHCWSQTRNYWRRFVQVRCPACDEVWASVMFKGSKRTATDTMGKTADLKSDGPGITWTLALLRVYPRTCFSASRHLVFSSGKWAWCLCCGAVSTLGVEHADCLVNPGAH